VKGINQSISQSVIMMMKEKILQKKCILGVNTAVRSVHLLDEDQILYSCGNHVLIWNKHTKNQIFLQQCGCGEEIQLIALCSARKQIAISIKGGDSGPQILIYDAINFKRKKVIKSQSVDDSDAIGVSFSKDGKQCLVLRDAPDYLLTLWNIEKTAKVLASIRLATPSGKRMKQAEMRLSSESKDVIVCASGNGIIRFFKIVDGIFRPITVNLRGEQQNYVAQSWLSNDVVILGTDNNELIVMHNFIAKAVVSIDGWNQCITSMIPFSQGIIVGGSKGSVRVYTCIEENNYTPSLAKEMSIEHNGNSEIVAIDKAATEEMFICLLSTGRICSFPLSDKDIAIGTNMVPWFHAAGPDGNCCITCMDICILKPIVATGGSDRTLRIWNYETKDFELTSNFDSDIISVSLHPSSLQILICFQNHIELNYIQHKGLSTVWRRDMQTDGSSCFSNGGQYFALVCGPFVQVYGTYKFDPICTLRGHSSPIKAIAWRHDDQELSTIGSDNVICKWTVSNGKRKIRHGKYKCFVL
jgi:WD40 repeat protein